MVILLAGQIFQIIDNFLSVHDQLYNIHTIRGSMEIKKATVFFLLMVEHQFSDVQVRLFKHVHMKVVGVMNIGLLMNFIAFMNFDYVMHLAKLLLLLIHFRGVK